MRRLLWLSCLLCLWSRPWSPSRADAAACCVSATVSGVGRLRNWEHFAVGLRTSLLAGTGQWDTKALWHGYGDDYQEHEWRSELWGLVGVHRRVSLFARVPWSVNYRKVGTQDAWDGWFGDLQAGARFELISIGQFLHVPAVALIVGVTAPTGRATGQAQNPLAADVTGRGAWMLSAGVTIEKTFYPGFVQLNAGVQVPLPSEREDLGVWQRFGPGIPVTLSGGVELGDTVVLALVARFFWEDQLVLGDRTIAGSSRIDAGIGLSASWSFDPHWTVQAMFDAGILADGWGLNQPGRLFVSLGLRYGYF
ncbi:MAG: transporter [Myxococcales bacterium]|nr:transporter [Myxococcales bacterium]